MTRLSAVALLLAACMPPHYGPAPQTGTDAGSPVESNPPAGCAAVARPAVIAPASVTPGAAVDRVIIRGRIVTPEVVFARGDVLVVADHIACVAADCTTDARAAGAPIVDTGGVVFPGLVDAHNHTQYNYLRPWTPPHLFQNRGQWAAIDDYKAAVATEYGNELGGDKMRTDITGVSSINATDAAKLHTDMLSGAVTAFVIHLAEGIDDTSRNELVTLESKGLLLSGTVLIHGTALKAAELARVAAAGAKIVWSPVSNLVLYGATTDVPAALAAGISVSLAPDWTPTGSATLLQELKAAHAYSCKNWNGLLSTKDLVQMATSIPADQLALGSQVGRLATGLLADLVVIADRGEDPYDTLVNAKLADVRLVMIGGSLRYGDTAAMAATRRTQCDTVSICSTDKLLCVPDGTDATDALNQSFSDIRTAVASFYANPYTLETCE